MMTLTDDLGRTVILPHPPRRIISLVPSVTLTLFDLGAGDLLVGRTTFCVHPAGEVNRLMSVGGTKKVSVEKVLALQPDLVLANKEENEKEQVEELGRHVPVFISDVKDLRDNERMLKQLGHITGCHEKADALALETRQRFAELEKTVTGRPRRKVLYVIWKSPYISVGSDTFIHHILSLAGFDNVFSDKKRYPVFRTEELTSLQPDVVLLSSEPYPFKEKHLQEFREMLPGVPVLLADGEYFSWYGSKMQDTPTYLTSLIT